MFFWAWEDHKNRMERAKNEGRAEAAKEYEASLAQVAKEYEVSLAQAAKERKQQEDALAAARERARAEGIDLDKYLNP